MSLLEGESVPWRDALMVEWLGTAERYGGEPGYDALVTQDSRVYAEHDIGEKEYCDMRSDPDQAKNLLDGRSEQEAEIAARLAAVRSAASDAYRAAKGAP